MSGLNHRGWKSAEASAHSYHRMRRTGHNVRALLSLFASKETDPQGMGMKYIPWALTVPVTTGVSTPVLKLSWPTNVGAAE